MENVIEKIKQILDEDAGVFIDNLEEVQKSSGEDVKYKKKIVDTRYESIIELMNSLGDQDTDFYTQLVKTFGSYIESLYHRKCDLMEAPLLNASKETIDRKAFYSKISEFTLESKNRDLAGKLFDYVCSILESHKDVTLDERTLREILNRSPRLFSLSAGESFISRPFRFDKLARTLEDNHTLEKSNIGIDSVYQVLINTFQIDNEDVFSRLVTPDDFKKDHQRVDEFLKTCNARTFARVTNIIRKHFDKDFDRLSFIKSKNSEGFCERLIIELLTSCVEDDNIDLIHELLNSDIAINYDYHYHDFAGVTDLRTTIAFSGRRVLISDLLSHEENVKNFYSSDEAWLALYDLYAYTGEYEKSLECFFRDYNYRNDYTEDFDDDFKKCGFTYGGFQYEDGVVRYLKELIASFTQDEIEYSRIKDIIFKILSSEKVRYVRLDETLPLLVNVLTGEDFNVLLDMLMGRHNAGSLDFIESEIDEKSMFTRYKISVVAVDSIESYIDRMKKKYEKTMDFRKDDTPASE